MGVIETALAWALNIANDNSHGYDQTNRWGPDYDCSSLVITAFKKAGLKLTSTYTGNMKADFMANGFADVTSQINLQTGAGLVKGDVLLNQAHHTALYIGDGMIVHASSNESGGARGGKTGDQTGREIYTRSYYNSPWDTILRYEVAPEPESKDCFTYTIKSGDTLWGLAQKYLGNGQKYTEIVELNNLGKNPAISPGMILRIPSSEKYREPIQITVSVLRNGNIGNDVKKAQKILQANGYSLQADGEFGNITESVVKKFQNGSNLKATGIMDKDTWEALLK